MEKETLNKGLHTDNTPLKQPSGTLRHAVNAVMETDAGEINSISSEQGNERVVHPDNLGDSVITPGHTLLTSLYIDENTTVLFTVKDTGSSKQSGIGILDKNNKYTLLVSIDLGFTLNTKIEAVYRLRRGCERVIYFTTPKPLYFNLDRPEKFKNVSNFFDASKFSLFRRYESIPTFRLVEAIEGGNLLAGSYNFAIQYLDQDFNPTEWITSTETVSIYHDRLSTSYHERQGSTNVVSNYQDFGGPTGKAITLILTNLDLNYTYYKIAIISATEGTGQITDVKYTSVISTTTTTFSYSGNNHASTGTIEDIQAFELIIDEAEYIEQIENRLVLGNVKGNETNFCELQKYASTIKTDKVEKEVILTDNVRDNPKDPTVHIDATGYMPGEIYSFGIVYIMSDSSVSPVYHIPGSVAGSGTNMSLDNQLENTLYLDARTSGGTEGYWGRDSQNNILNGERVRHHRFPTRITEGEDMVAITGGYSRYRILITTFSGTGIIKTNYPKSSIQVTLVYTSEGGTYQENFSINVDNYTQTGLTVGFQDSYFTGVKELATAVKVYEDGVLMTGAASSATDLVYTATPGIVPNSTRDNVLGNKTNMFGVKFSNIVKPDSQFANGKEVIGYYIVRNEATEENRTVLDSGVVLPTQYFVDNKYVGYGVITPTDVTVAAGGVTSDVTIKPDMFGLVYPEHLFNNKQYKGISRIRFQAQVDNDELNDSSYYIQDVAAGTSYDSSVHKKGAVDYDGYTLHVLNSSVASLVSTYAVGDSTSLNISIDPVWEDDIKEIYYLDALESAIATDYANIETQVFNLSTDNKVAIVTLSVADQVLPIVSDDTSFLYGYLERDLTDPYSEFRNLPYYKESENYNLFATSVETTTIFNGDVFMTGMTYSSTTSQGIEMSDRAKKNKTWKTVVGVLAVVGGTILSFASPPAGIMVIGFGLSQIAAGVKSHNINKVLNELYENGLDNTIRSKQTEDAFNTTPDDEIRWRMDTTPLWFESRVNIGLRKGATIGVTDFLPYEAPQYKVDLLGTSTNINLSNPNYRKDAAIVDPGAVDGVIFPPEIHAMNKLTVVDTDNEGGRLYSGYPSAELYEVNADYRRRNKEKVYFHLPLEYDCGSACIEDFPHRVHYSQQAFQEEREDNYQVFLPNNFRDIESSSGDITDIFRMRNNLYIHTEEALWHLPQNIQERVTGDIVAFIGTGDFFSVPPRKIVDGDQVSAGTRYSRGSIKTEYGVYFLSDGDKKIYEFNGSALNAISNAGMSKWFKENMTFKFLTSYYTSNARTPSWLGSTTVAHGFGFVSAYDSQNERLLFTKRDYEVTDTIAANSDYELTFFNSNIYIFNGFEADIASKLAGEFVYLGIVEDEMRYYNYRAKASTFTAGTILPVADLIKHYDSWTISYSLKNKVWASYHSYLPALYLTRPDRLYSYFGGVDLWEHNVKGLYNSYFGEDASHIIEFVAVASELENATWDAIEIHSKAKGYDTVAEEYVDNQYRTFERATFYNSRQLSGELDLIVKDSPDNFTGVDYLKRAVKNTVGSIQVSSNEGIWSLNDFRDIVVDYEVPLFTKDKALLYPTLVLEYVDKIINSNAVNGIKDWTQSETFRDKFLVVRLENDRTTIKLVTDFSTQEKTKSIR